MSRLFIVFVLLCCLPGCRKGENDPFFSVLSRKERVTGKWTLKEMDRETVITTIQGYDSTITETLFNNELRVSGTSARDLEWEYAETLEIKKDGSYTWKYIYGLVSYIEEGTWCFSRRNKNADLKNKEALIFEKSKYTKYDEEDGVQWTEEYNGIQNSEIFLERIDELKNNEMCFIYNSDITDARRIRTVVSGYKLFIK